MSFTAKNFEELTGKEVYEILRARSRVFMLEQQIHCQDMDRVDYRARHCFVTDPTGEVIAYLRAFEEDPTTVRIGRVLAIPQGEGRGRELMQSAVSDLRTAFSAKTLTLDSQEHAVGFYEKLGFAVTSAPFLEEGVPHVKMQKNL